MTDTLWSELNKEIKNNLHAHKMENPESKFDDSPDDRLTRMNSFIRTGRHKKMRVKQEKTEQHKA